MYTLTVIYLLIVILMLTFLILWLVEPNLSFWQAVLKYWYLMLIIFILGIVSMEVNNGILQ